MSFLEVFIFNRVSFCFVIVEISAKAISRGMQKHLATSDKSKDLIAYKEEERKSLLILLERKSEHS